MENVKIDLRLEALKRFALAITILHIAGHFFLGFEASWAQPLTALCTSYSLEIFFEILNSRLNKKPLAFAGGIKKFIWFLLPGHISAMAVSMLLFTNERITPTILATAIAILSKIIFKVKINGASKHFFNPSNIGIASVLILFPWVGIAPPYQFTENFSGLPDWILPVIFISIGSFLNTKFTKKMPLIFAWFIGFLFQAVIRNIFFGDYLLAALNPMSGVAFLLFSFYMISDPATTPFKFRNQLIFGFSVALVYGILVKLHIVFGLFFSLTIVCFIRGVYFTIKNYSDKPITEKKETEQFANVANVGVEYYAPQN